MQHSQSGGKSVSGVTREPLSPCSCCLASIPFKKQASIDVAARIRFINHRRIRKKVQTLTKNKERGSGMESEPFINTALLEVFV